MVSTDPASSLFHGASLVLTEPTAHPGPEPDSRATTEPAPGGGAVRPRERLNERVARRAAGLTRQSNPKIASTRSVTDIVSMSGATQVEGAVLFAAAVRLSFASLHCHTMNLMYSVPTQALRMTSTVPPIPPSMAGGVKIGSCTDDLTVLTPNIKAPLSESADCPRRLDHQAHILQYEHYSLGNDSAVL